MSERPDSDQAVTEVLDPTGSVADLPVDPAAVVPRVRPGRRAAWAAVGCGVALAGLTVAVAREQPGVVDLDVALHGWVLAHRGPADSALALAVTWAGATYVAIPALFVAGCWARAGHRRLRERLGSGLLLAGAVSVGVYAGLLVNHVVGRARPPYEDWWGAAGGPAFPSGHTTTGTAVAVAVAWALAERWPQRRARLAGGAVAVAVAVGWSRVWLGVHWPTDVVGGWLLGAGWVVGVMLVLELLRRRREGSG